FFPNCNRYRFDIAWLSHKKSKQFFHRTHHPKGGVAYVEIAGSSFRPSGRDKVGDYHHTQKITALSQPGR
ncbi:MAG: hypothetical protein SO146_07430, partial [Eubacteriales bacterium]|nr:hypothetical protein [Eubacteriales bacterium]